MAIADRTFGCGAELAIEILGGKWKLVLLAKLTGGPLRYAELRARIPLSDKVLTQRLSDLVELGLVVRHKRGGRGAPSSYQLTERALSLAPALEALYRWGEQIAKELGATIEPARAVVDPPHIRWVDSAGRRRRS